MTIKCINVCKYYGNDETVHALEKVNLLFDKPELVFIIGESGSGKSTLLNILGGLDSASKGTVFYGQNDTSTFSESDWDKYRNMNIGFIFQDFNLHPALTVFENVKLGLDIRKIRPCDSSTDEQVLKALSDCGLADKGKRKVSELSGGEKQRVAIARTLVKNPEFIFADEPTGNLDRSNSRTVFEQLEQLSNNHCVLVVSHDLISARKYADRIIEISDGKIIKDEPNVYKTRKVRFLLENDRDNFVELSDFQESINDGFLGKSRFDTIVGKLRVIAEEKIPLNGSSNFDQTNQTQKRLSFLRKYQLARVNIRKRKSKLIWTIIVFALTNFLTLLFCSLSGINYTKKVSNYLKKYGSNFELILPYDPEYSLEDNQCRGKDVLSRIYSEIDKNDVSFFLNERYIWFDDNEKKTDKEAYRFSNYFESGIYVIPENFCFTGNVQGRLPKNENEIAITDFMLKSFETYSDNIEYLQFDGKTLEVVGIISTDFETLYRNTTQENEMVWNNNRKYYYNVVFISENFFKMKAQENQWGIALPCADLTFRANFELLKNSSAFYKFCRNISEKDLLVGTLPNNRNEIVVSETYSSRLGFSVDEIVGKKLVLYDINENRQDKAVDYFNLYDYFQGEIKVCGVTRDTSANIFVCDDVFNEMKDQYYKYYYFDSVAVNTNGKEDNYCKKLQKQMFLWGNYDIIQMYNFRAEFELIFPIIRIINIVLIFISISLVVSFIMFTEKENRHEIGILRALGVTRRDIVSIFYFETSYICMISLLVGLAMCLMFYKLLRTLLEAEIVWYNQISVLTIEPLLTGLVMLFIWIAFLLAVSLPIIKITSKKPIEILRWS